ncbi:MAG: DUF11 domain-containing protein [Candidatus Thiothrix singaporensis]|uniref:DUF11 domain-containing protein n=1 Tax=Candidatus Thiothrix singaporensis TaxID=2799669 RepID=A0A7L6AXC4_9GAMM|nr:MAG: DUF11 domain-containing protein [Candidatus Thiothrix singaporensis]
MKYTVTAINGGDTATGVEVQDLLPAGVTYQTYNASQGVYTNSTGIWAVGSLDNGESATLTIEVKAN